ncbi:MAG: thioredoxin domain-containing protein [Actinomycetales bacterium]|nr:thioredoxin domain-containing protein [Actinomycetales bacterium]
MTNARTARNAREKSAALRAKAEREESRRRTVRIAVSVVVVIVLAVVAVVIVQIAREKELEASGSKPPRHLTDGAFAVGSKDAPVTVTVYEDFLCAACKTFERANRDQFAQWVDAGLLRIAYRPIAVLDYQSKDFYPSRAVVAAAAVMDLAPEGFPAFHAALFDNQPAPGGEGLPEEKIIEFAVQAGAPRAEVTKAIKDSAYRGWVVDTTKDAAQAGIGEPPVVLVNDKPVTALDEDSVRAALEAAARAEGATPPPASSAASTSPTTSTDD